MVYIQHSTVYYDMIEGMIWCSLILNTHTILLPTDVLSEGLVNMAAVAHSGGE